MPFSTHTPFCGAARFFRFGCRHWGWWRVGRLTALLDLWLGHLTTLMAIAHSLGLSFIGTPTNRLRMVNDQATPATPGGVFDGFLPTWRWRGFPRLCVFPAFCLGACMPPLQSFGGKPNESMRFRPISFSCFLLPTFYKLIFCIKYFQKKHEILRILFMTILDSNLFRPRSGTVCPRVLCADPAPKA